MKKLLTLFVMLLMGISLYAQDVIVKKNGTTILAKVLTVGTKVVEYKKWTNQDGPTYSIEKKELLSINYANGEQDMFSDAEEDEEAEAKKEQSTYTPSDISKAVSNSVSQAAYISSAGRGKIIGGALTLALVGIPCLASGIAGYVLEAPTAFSVTMSALGVLGTASGSAFIKQGRDDKKDAIRWHSASVLQHDFKVGDYTLTPSVDVFNDHMTQKKGIGAGLAFRF